VFDPHLNLSFFLFNNMFIIALETILSHKGENATDISAQDKITRSYCVSVCMKELWKSFCNFDC
jgi:hypothetical protein